MNKVRDLYFTNETTTFERVNQRLIMDSNFELDYLVEKWMEKHVSISRKNTFYHM